MSKPDRAAAYRKAAGSCLTVAAFLLREAEKAEQKQKRDKK